MSIYVLHFVQFFFSCQKRNKRKFVYEETILDDVTLTSVMIFWHKVASGSCGSTDTERVKWSE